MPRGHLNVFQNPHPSQEACHPLGPGVVGLAALPAGPANGHGLFGLLQEVSDLVSAIKFVAIAGDLFADPKEIRQLHLLYIRYHVSGIIYLELIIGLHIAGAKTS